MANEDNQSRRERRKEARLSKNKKKYDSWLQHHQNSLKNEKIQQGIVAPKNSTDLFKDSVSDPEYDIDPSPVVENSEVQAKIHTSGKIGKKKQSSDVNLVGELVGRSGKKTDHLPASCNVSNHTEDSDGLKKVTKKKRKKTRFEEYFDLENGIIPADEDLALEKRLAKKLKVKRGKLKGDDDGINMLFDDIPSALELFEDEELQSAAKSAPKAPDKTLHKKSKHLKSSKQRHVIEGEQEQDQRSVKTSDKEFEASFPPTTSCIDVELGKHSAQTALGGNTTKYIAPHKRSQMGSESQDNAQIRKQVRGLLNRLSESNVESITGEMSTIIHMGGRSLGSLIICEEVLASCSAGPRGNEQYAAVFAAFVAGMSCLVGIDFGAKILASLAKRFEEEYLKEDNMSLRNLTLLFSYLYIFGVFSSDLIYDFLVMLSKRLTEGDVSTILAVLQSCGMKLRGDDPIAMKDFINSIQNRVNELKTLSRDAQSSKRMELMLQTICEIKNNKKRQKEETVQLTRIKKWLQKLRVDDILLRGLKWCKLLDGEKKGLWWLSGDVNVNSDQKNIRKVANTIDMEVLEAQKMLQLAATQRMNTDARRAIFCVIMSGEDYIDAFEKLLRLDLPGKQDREVMRVLVECCLQEKVFNKYYCALASKLCSHDKNHKFTLQYCLWDKFKEVESIRSMHLSKFVAEMLACFALSLSVLKAVDLGHITELTPKKIMHFRMLFEAIFEFPDELVWNIFTRIALPEYETLCNGIVIFIREYVAAGQKSLAAKFKIAKKAINNIEGVLM